MGLGIKIKTPKIGGWDPGKTISNVFKNPGKELSNAGKNVMGYASPLYALMNASGAKPPSPDEDPQVAALRKKLYGEATKFREDLPGMQAQESQSIGRQAQSALESGVRGTRENYNSRGLLYSGMRQGAEQGVRGRVASTMANQKAQSNKYLEDLASAKELTAARVGQQGFDEALRRQSEIENIRLQSQIARQQAFQQMGQSAGQMAGSIYGYQNARAPQADPGYNNTLQTYNQYSPSSGSVYGKASLGGSGTSPWESPYLADKRGVA